MTKDNPKMIPEYITNKNMQTGARKTEGSLVFTGGLQREFNPQMWCVVGGGGVL